MSRSLKLDQYVYINKGQQLFIIYLYKWDHGEGDLGDSISEKDRRGIACDCNLIPSRNKARKLQRVETFNGEQHLSESVEEEFLVRMKAI